MFKIYNDDCFNILPDIKKKSVDLVLVDLPYGITSCKWDSVIDLKQMWFELKKCCKRKCIYIFFCTTKFGYKIIESNYKWFRYSLVWEKSKKVGFLNCNKQPLRNFEMMYVFSNNDDDINNEYNLNLRKYAEKVKKFINRPIKQIDGLVGNQGIHHFYSFKSSQFGIPTETNYNKLKHYFKIKNMEGFREYKSLKDEWIKHEKKTYNPQMVKGKPYKNKGRKDGNTGVYGNVKGDPIDNKGTRFPASILYYPETPEKQESKEHEMLYVMSNPHGGKKTYNPQMVKGKPYKKKKNIYNGEVYNNAKPFINTPLDNKGTRHPTTIVKFNNPVKSLHRTQKPVLLCEWLIKSYSNENDLILDFTMGSGTTGVACKNTNRQFIGIEKDKKIFEIAKKRLIC